MLKKFMEGIKDIHRGYKRQVDPKQFGCLKGTSTTYCLLDMIHTGSPPWLDTSGNRLRLCFLDFAKPFNRIGHNVLVVKLIDIEVKRSLIPWFFNFHINRSKRVNIFESSSN